MQTPDKPKPPTPLVWESNAANDPEPSVVQGDTSACTSQTWTAITSAMSKDLSFVKSETVL